MITRAKMVRLSNMHGWTAKDIAEAAQIKRMRYYMWEAGKPYYHLNELELERLSEIFQLPLAEIADETGAPIIV